MTVEEAVIDQLLATSGVTDLVSQRVWPLKLPQHPVLPAIRVQLIDEPEDAHLRGYDALKRARVQIDIYDDVAGVGNPYTTVRDIATAVEDALRPQPFSVGSPAIVVMHARRLLRREMYEGDEFEYVRLMMDFELWSQVAAA